MAEEATVENETAEAQVTAGAQGTLTTTPSWTATLPEELRAEKAIADYPDVTALVKSHVSLQKMLGDSVRIPKEGAPPEDVAKFRQRMGVPETADKYEIARPEHLPEGVTWDEPTLAEFRTLAHGLGLTPAQVKALADFDLKRTVSTVDRTTEATAKARREAERALEKKWGPKGGPVYQRNYGLASKAVDTFLPQDSPLRAALDASRGNDPALIEFLAQVGERMLEDGAIEPGEYETESTEATQARIETAREWLIKNPSAPDYEARLNAYHELFRRLPGGREVIIER